jgi:type 1 glutamine amidotransferase
MKKITLIVFSVSLMLSGFVKAEQFKVMVFTKTDGWHHKSQLEGVLALRKLAQKHFFELEWHEDASRINDKNLTQFDAIIFLSTTGNILSDEQQKSLEKFIQSGKGYVGVHSASDTEYDWPWYRKLVGRMFVIHPVNQTARVNVVNRNFPGVELMPDSFLWTDEFYQFSEPEVKGLNTILTVDETTYDPKADWGKIKGEGNGSFHPVSWYHEFDGGRSFYTALGHIPAIYEDDMFLSHLYGGIYWAATGKGLLADK